MFANSLSACLLAGLLAGPAADRSPVELRYRGSFSKASRDGEATADPVKRFDLDCLVTPRGERGRDVAFVLDEQGGGSWPWPARYGSVAVDAENHPAQNRLRLLHTHDGAQYVLAVPFPYFEFAHRLAADARWEAPREAELTNQHDKAPWKYRVTGSAKVAGRECWRVEVVNNFGPQERLWIDKTSPLLVKAERRIVIGRGDVHLLKMELDLVRPLSAESLAKSERPLQDLLRLQQQLKRSPDDKTAELNESQLKMAAAALKTLESEAEGTPLDRFVASIARDVNSQTRRTGDVDSLSKRFVGKPAPAIQMKSLDNEPIDRAEHAGKIVLLHFWSYQGEPFPAEPYGQIGYLEFLHNRRKKLGVQVFGVAVDKRLSDASQAPAVVRSIRKLQNFMNLSYPLTLDDGTLLEKFGDPERVGAKLPLWVLIDPAGTVVEYKVGHYDIKADEGLSQLDKAVLRLVRKQRKTNPTTK